ncbi:MAG: DUF5777 family beta-barrel protein [Bacteroidetes bacterium]|nr:DUF5777 family beta-barrel protein [Bacteroidota bacterium]MDA1224285.1 DUF5777 family beta-barrel protein [Bacteroidota bacterium]
MVMRKINMNTWLRFVAMAFGSFAMNVVQAQDDTSFSLFDEPSAPVAEKVQYAFKTTKVVNLQSLELIDPGVFDFKMSHRFGAMNGGAAAFNNEDVVNAFGLDVATIRFGGEYGVNENLMVGLGRYNVNSEKGVDAYLKYRLMHQTSDNKKPLSILLLGAVDYKNTQYDSIIIGIAGPVTITLGVPGKQRLSFVGQVIVGKKVNDNFSWIISPTVVVSGMNDRYDAGSETFVSSGTDKTQFALGMGFRNKLSSRTSLNMEYIPILNGNGDFYNSFSVGFDVETGGHVFQFDFTNSVGMNESMFITRNTDRWGAAGVRLGFNLHRVFTVVDPSRFQ